jgi:hypothetical protein
MSNMKRTAATIVTVSHHHMPDGADYPVEEGMTLRQALAALRSAGRDNFGNLGGMTAMLSDCTSLEVCNQPAIGGGRLMGTQVIRREIDNRVSTLVW